MNRDAGNKAAPQAMMTLGLVQMAMTDDFAGNIRNALEKVKEAAAKGCNVILLPELFAGPYFCQLEREKYFSWAETLDSHSFLGQFQALAAALQVVLPVSFFESSGPSYFNSIVLFDADGRNLGIYRKSHIPDGPGYEEKYYFAPGDSGFKVWKTKWGTIGVGICWDQWFPECARIMALKGADLLLYPTAIGSEPADEVETPNSYAMWQRAMIGHAVSNSCYVAAANRIGREQMENAVCEFYGHSFVCDVTGDMLVEADENFEGVIQAKLDLQRAKNFRSGMGFFRDRRPELYRSLLTLDGRE